jgi:hypothetical protein
MTCAIGHNNLIFWYVLKNQVEFRPRLGKKGGLPINIKRNKKVKRFTIK